MSEADELRQRAEALLAMAIKAREQGQFANAEACSPKRPSSSTRPTNSRRAGPARPASERHYTGPADPKEKSRGRPPSTSPSQSFSNRCAQRSKRFARALATIIGSSATARANFPKISIARSPTAAGSASASRKSHGGAGLGVAEAAIMMQTITASGAGLSGASAVHMNIFGLNPVVVYGSEEQKRRMLPPIAAGKEKACFAVTEANAGLETAKLQNHGRAPRRHLRHQRRQNLDFHGASRRQNAHSRAHRADRARVASRPTA